LFSGGSGAFLIIYNKIGWPRPDLHSLPNCQCCETALIYCGSGSDFVNVSTADPVPDLVPAPDPGQTKHNFSTTKKLSKILPFLLEAPSFPRNLASHF
jgi:hypothetical protein